ncbi:MAG: ATP-binding cassette domain-containing protein [Deltaproteobacteria bacterium]|nr:ATP-binding cassette domain-containing protein [Deltaproteobacteria bacterium]
MIEMENITKSFRQGEATATILKGISLFIGEGEFVSIMGPSGSGKSTLSSILGCLASPSSGIYRIDKQEITSMKTSELAKLRNRKIGFVFQDFNLLDGLSAVDNVALPLFYAGVSPRDRRDRATECLKNVGLEARMNHLPNQLSGGQKQRVAIARALVNEPSFIFADEPTGALDKRTGHEIMALLQKLNLAGHTVIQVTHSAIDANYSKRILHLVDGLIVKDELVERPTIGATAVETDDKVETISRLWRVAQLVPTNNADDFKALEKLLGKNQDQLILVEAIKALIRWTSAEADNLLWSLVKNKDWTVRAEVVKTCPTRGPQAAIPFLVFALDDENAWIRFMALSHLRKMGMPVDETAIRKLISMLADPDERVRAAIVTQVAQWDFPERQAQVLSATTDIDGRVRANAIEALWKCSQKNAPDPIVSQCFYDHLSDKNNRARANAALALHAHRPKEAFDELMKMLESENNLMRASSAWALGQLTEIEAANLLLGKLKAEKEETVLAPMVRSLANLCKCFPFHKQVEALLQKE